MTPTPILYIDPAPFAGGAQQSLRTLLDALDSSRFQPFAAGPELLREFVPPGCWLPLSLPSMQRSRSAAGGFRFLGQSLAAGLRLALVVRHLRPSLLHANGRGAWLPSWLASRLCRVPLVWHSRDLVGPLLYDCLAASLCHLCIVPSRVVADRLLTGQAASLPLLSWRRRHIRVIPNGVNLEQFQPGNRKTSRLALDLPPDQLIIGMLGQWVPWKGVEIFLQAAHLAAAQDSRLFFLLCGSPPPGEGEHLRAAYQAALAPIGRVMEWTSNVPQLLSALDILAHPAVGEAFGRTVVEAMSCGLPVVAARAGALPETVLDGVTGLLIPPNDPSALASALLSLARNPQQRARMGSEGQRRVKECCTAEKHAALVQEEYRRLLRRHKNTSSRRDRKSVNGSMSH